MYDELRGSYDLNLACARAHGIGKPPIDISIGASEHSQVESSTDRGICHTTQSAAVLRIHSANSGALLHCRSAVKGY